LRKIVYLLGIDGSGKTTLSNNLLNYYKSKSIKVTYFYGRHFPFLLQPFKTLGKITVLKRTDEFINYNIYKNKKNSFFSRHRLIATLYKIIWIADYLVITFLRFIPRYFNKDMVIIDRFFLDVAVNISESLSLDDMQMVKLARFLGCFFPSNTLNIFIKVSPEVAFSRKNDIQAIRYLEERNKRYKILSELYKFIEINGEEPPEIVFEQVKEIIEKIKK